MGWHPSENSWRTWRRVKGRLVVLKKLWVGVECTITDPCKIQLREKLKYTMGKLAQVPRRMVKMRVKHLPHPRTCLHTLAQTLQGGEQGHLGWDCLTLSVTPSMV
jgi:hypothetical protein